MGYRGRLIHSCIAELAQLDTSATVYNEHFREAAVSAPEDGEGVGEEKRAEKLIKLPAQWVNAQHEHLTATTAGNQADSTVVLVFHFRDLERLGLIDEFGYAKIRQSDRLVATYDRFSGKLIQSYDRDLGVYAREVKPYGVGIGDKRNLCKVTFESLDRGGRTAQG